MHVTPRSLSAARRPTKCRFLSCLLAAALVMTLLSIPAAAQNNPFVFFMVPTIGPPGTVVTISGSDFGEVTQSCSVTFNGVPGRILNWDSTGFPDIITVSVPDDATTGPVQVKTQTGALSNTVTFTVTTPGPIPTPGAGPHIDSISPTSGPVGSRVQVDGSNFGVTQGLLTFNNVPATTIGLWTNTSVIASVPQQATSGPVVVTTTNGASNGVNFDVTSGTAAAQTWYLAEGCTVSPFETYILMENTTGVDATVNIVYNTASVGRVPRPQPLNVPPNSRVTIRLNDEVANQNVSTLIMSSVDIVCERAMYWNNRIEGTDSIGTTTLSRTWYMAEGYTDNSFETWVLIQNPGNMDANVDVTYMTQKGAVQKPRFQVGAGARYSLNVGKDVGPAEVSTRVVADQDVVCERAEYWNNRRGGHCSIGVPRGSKDWYLAEGSTAWGYTTYLLLQNPTDKKAEVDVTYMTSGGPVQQPHVTMDPNTRRTFRVSDYVTNDDTSIRVKSDEEIIAERSMYWNNGTGMGGTDTVGNTAPTNTVFLAEGSTAWGFQTYVCIQNPNDQEITFKVTYLKNDGPMPTPERQLAANSRTTVFANSEIPNKDCSIKVEASLPIMAERAMYWNDKGGGHVSIGLMK